MTFNDFVDKRKVQCMAERTGFNPSIPEWTDADHWIVKLRLGGRVMTTHFSMGYGHGGKPPEAADVLACMQADYVWPGQEFEAWALDHGWDTDSRQADHSYKGCLRRSKRLEQFLGPALDELPTLGG